MRSSTCTRSLSVLLALALVLCPFETIDSAHGQSAPAPIAMKTGALKGWVLDVDALTPIKGVKISLLDYSGEALIRTTTDSGGNFALGTHEPGEYQLLVGKTHCNLNVTQSSGITSLKIVIPKRLALDIDNPDDELLTLAGKTPDGATSLLTIDSTHYYIVAGGAILAGITTGGAVYGGVRFLGLAKRDHVSHFRP